MFSKKSPQINYKYLVFPIGNQDEPAYKAVIPAFNNAIVYGDTLEEIGEGVQFAIEEEIKDLNTKGLSISKQDVSAKTSGRILIRISPVLHEKLMIEAMANQKSLNRYIEEKLSGDLR